MYYYIARRDNTIHPGPFAIFLALYAFTLLILLGWRSDFVMMALLLVFGYHYLVKRLSFKIAVIAAVILFSVVVLFDVFRQGKIEEGLVAVSTSLYSTLFVDSSNLAIIMDNVPGQSGFLHGQTFLTAITMLLPGNDDSLGEILRDKFTLMEGGGGITVTIFGEWYINFGMTGIFIGIVLIGIIAGFAYNWMKSRRDFFSVFIYALIIYQLFVFIRIGLFTSIMPWLIIPMLIYYRKLCLLEIDSGAAGGYLN